MDQCLCDVCAYCCSRCVSWQGFAALVGGCEDVTNPTHADVSNDPDKAMTYLR